MKHIDKEIFKNQHFLFVFDLDGTLLNEKKTINPLTKGLLKELESYGNIITMASGRSQRAVMPYFVEMGLKGPFICYNGSVVVDPYDESFPKKRTVIKKEFIYDFFKKFSMDTIENFMIEDEKVQYCYKKNNEYTFFFAPEGIGHKFGSVFSNIHEDMLCMVIQTKDLSKNKEISEYVRNNFDDLGIRFWDDASTFGEIYHYSVNKSTSIEYIAEHYNIDKQHIICFGDAMNDIEMIRKAGISFAMKNGADKLKKEATYVTPFSNDEEGIYYALLDLFGKE